MGRLIDADKLLETLQDLEPHCENKDYEYGMLNTMRYYMPKIINDEPTVIDVDKVVADQALHNYNTLTKAYEKLGQAGGGTRKQNQASTLRLQEGDRNARSSPRKFCRNTKQLRGMALWVTSAENNKQIGKAYYLSVFFKEHEPDHIFAISCLPEGLRKLIISGFSGIVP